MGASHFDDSRNTGLSQPTESDARTRHLLRSRPYPAKLSLVAPMYNEEAVVPQFRAAVEAFIDGVHCPVEIVIVNDGSSDRTLSQLVEWTSANPCVRVLHLSRNFGHQVAATAGLDHATGDAIVLVDGDLQDPLPVIHQMIERYCEGYDVVYGQRESRADEPCSKRATAWLFYRLMRAFVCRELPVDTGDFRLLSRGCLDALNTMRETHRFLRGMVAWLGYPQVAVRYHRQGRAHGTSKYPLKKMLAFAWTAATSFSAAPLRASAAAGALAGMLGIEEGIRAALASVFGWYTVPGWKSLMVVTTLIGGATLMSIGIVGEYLARLYEQAKERPLYMVAREFHKGSAETVVSDERACIIHLR
ncbi:MAG TPA: glycosyltransferase family 2 protein [Bryobacteraceae bacterium]|nr:glycosyltransferase family 2 protein [Bryobacteraceae bacterium]